MAKKNTFDPDAISKFDKLSEVGKDVTKKHVEREQGSTTDEPKKKPGRQTTEETQLCRIGITYHRRVKFAATKEDKTIRQYLEDLIEKHVPEF